MSIAYYQTSVQGTLDKYPKTPSPLMQFLNVEHLMMNDYMHELVTLVADLNGYLEKAETNLAYITVQFLLYRSTLITWKQSATSATSSLMLPLVLYPYSTKEYFLHPVYVIAMYLSPKYCHLAISKNFTHDYLKPEIVKLTMNWKFKKDECIQLAQDIHKYDLFSFTKDHKTMTPMSFWKIAQQFTKPTRKLASFVFRLKGHAAPMETLFSSLSCSKPKIKNKMMTDNLKIIGSIHKSLKDSIPTQRKKIGKGTRQLGLR